MEQATYQELTNAKATLERNGYEAAFHADQFGHIQFVIVQDPVHRIGTGASAGKLVLMGYEPTVIRTYDAARKFINVRS